VAVDHPELVDLGRRSGGDDWDDGLLIALRGWLELGFGAVLRAIHQLEERFPGDDRELRLDAERLEDVGELVEELKRRADVRLELARQLPKRRELFGEGALFLGGFALGPWAVGLAAVARAAGTT